MANLNIGPAQAIRFWPESVRSVTAGQIVAAGAYLRVGTMLNYPIRQFFLQNLTDALLMFSFDGVNDHFPLPAQGFFLNDVTSNKTSISGAWYLAQGTQLYVKEIGVPTTGSVYFSVFYGVEI